MTIVPLVPPEARERVARALLDRMTALCRPPAHMTTQDQIDIAIGEYVRALAGFDEGLLTAVGDRLVRTVKAKDGTASFWPAIATLLELVEEERLRGEERRVITAGGKVNFLEFWPRVREIREAAMRSLVEGGLYARASEEGWGAHLRWWFDRIARVQAQCLALREAGLSPRPFTIDEQKLFHIGDMEQAGRLTALLTSEEETILRARAEGQREHATMRGPPLRQVALALPKLEEPPTHAGYQPRFSVPDPVAAADRRDDPPLAAYDGPADPDELLFGAPPDPLSEF